MQLYASAAADAVLEGKAAAPAIAASEKDDFVELDADGNPVSKKDARERDDRRRPSGPRKPGGDKRPPAGRRGPPGPRGPKTDAPAAE